MTRLLTPRFLRAVAVCLTASIACVSSAQQPAPTPSPGQMQADIAKNPQLLIEIGNLIEKIQAGVKLPGPRTESRLMPLAPKSTIFYAASPNYGDAAMQALTIFRQQLKQSATLRQWWHSGDMAKTAPDFEDAVEKFYRISQYLGDEIALSAGVDGETPNVLLVAEIKKPGLKEALQQTVRELLAKSKAKPEIRILDLQDLAGMPEKETGKDLLILVRPDYLVVAADAATLRSFNARLDSGPREFPSTPFGQRVAQAYRDNVTMVGAFDLQTILAKARTATTTVPNQAQALAVADQSGFADAQYLVWEHASSGGRDLSETELSFTGPRRGVAAWLGAPSNLGSLDFASPKAIMALSVVLKNPAQIFDDVRAMVTAANPKAFDGVFQMERQMNISLRDDLLRPLGGELALELDAITPAPVWKAMLRVDDPVRLQRTITTLLASAPFKPEQVVNAGVTYHKLALSSGPKPTEIAYAFVDNYLVIGSSTATAFDAVRLHRSGESLGKSKRFLDSLPPGHAAGASALIYQDPMAMAAFQAKNATPDMTATLAKISGQNTPAVMAAYAEEKSIRGASTSPTMDAAVVMIVAAVAIPNLLRSRTAANEATAVGSLRTLNTAQVTYAAIYPEHGFARTLSTLGIGPTVTAEHAGLIDASLGCADAAGCEKSGYRFRLSAICLEGQCAQYVVTATPVSSSTGSRNFCTTADGVIHFQVGPPLTTPIRVPDCRRWRPLQ
ncbi:MAG: hypothetical protein ACRD3E_06685 [Terriglobales bacterium]